MLGHGGVAYDSQWHIPRSLQEADTSHSGHAAEQVTDPDARLVPKDVARLLPAEAATLRVGRVGDTGRYRGSAVVRVA